jgi:hypothetical protein
LRGGLGRRDGFVGADFLVGCAFELRQRFESRITESERVTADAEILIVLPGSRWSVEALIAEGGSVLRAEVAHENLIGATNDFDVPT